LVVSLSEIAKLCDPAGTFEIVNAGEIFEPKHVCRGSSEPLLTQVPLTENRFAAAELVPVSVGARVVTIAIDSP
jgi:hypothetical protein